MAPGIIVKLGGRGDGSTRRLTRIRQFAMAPFCVAKTMCATSGDLAGKSCKMSNILPRGRKKDMQVAHRHIIEICQLALSVPSTQNMRVPCPGWTGQWQEKEEDDAFPEVNKRKTTGWKLYIIEFLCRLVLIT
ncbi:hypothetical protein Fcan01_03707 [Folsomia candida]|uniref:Uncharacterized protein n=1 Tax=Folsomia candida TaxID=158441 RepID=A0A226EXB6_FOLCA|nr:hypothetical protein Fcan01_03707 [Folsomia candida]